mmetsp:Transcript_59865/g.140970  ORF Transcript_59865/g.140970 Transcript_59865/m.140970 type:complete len:327 (-) Transcript_59865:505-1485(-)
MSREEGSEAAPSSSCSSRWWHTRQQGQATGSPVTRSRHVGLGCPLSSTAPSPTGCVPFGAAGLNVHRFHVLLEMFGALALYAAPKPCAYPTCPSLYSGLPLLPAPSPSILRRQPTETKAASHPSACSCPCPCSCAAFAAPLGLRGGCAACSFGLRPHCAVPLVQPSTKPASSPVASTMRPAAHFTSPNASPIASSSCRYPRLARENRFASVTVQPSASTATWFSSPATPAPLRTPSSSASASPSKPYTETRPTSAVHSTTREVTRRKGASSPQHSQPSADSLSLLSSSASFLQRRQHPWTLMMRNPRRRSIAQTAPTTTSDSIMYT